MKTSGRIYNLFTMVTSGEWDWRVGWRRKKRELRCLYLLPVLSFTHAERPEEQHSTLSWAQCTLRPMQNRFLPALYLSFIWPLSDHLWGCASFKGQGVHRDMICLCPCPLIRLQSRYPEPLNSLRIAMGSFQGLPGLLRSDLLSKNWANGFLPTGPEEQPKAAVRI